MIGRMIQPRFADLLDRVMGLDAALIGTSAVDRAVDARIRANNLPGTDAYWALLQQAPDEVQALIETVVIPETWFFRDPAAFDAMVRLCAPRLADGSAPLRILSLPCSTGRSPIPSPWRCSMPDGRPRVSGSMGWTSAIKRWGWRGARSMGAIPSARWIWAFATAISRQSNANGI
jgi:hypothetical protein